MNTYVMPNELFMYCGISFLYFFEYGTQSFLFFSFITNSTSRMHAHTGIKHFHKLHYPPKKNGGKQFCILAGARGSSSLSSLLFRCLLLLLQLYVCSDGWFFFGICLSTRFLSLINTIVQHLTFVCFCFA